MTARANDERLLAMLAARASGMSSAEVAEVFGVAPAGVRVHTNKVMNADLEESGEPPDRVRAAYWSRNTGKRRRLS